MHEIIIQENTFEKARKIINKNKDKKIIFSSDNDELNRKVLEKLEINIILLNQKNRKDFQKQRNSGCNQVLAKLAKKKGIAIGINFDELKNSKSLKEKSEIIARVRQNIILCNKNKLKMKFISKEKKPFIHDLKALGLSLGMPTWMTKEL